MAKTSLRADALLVQKGVAESREQAKRLIMAGKAYILSPSGRERILKPGRPLSPETAVAVDAPERFVSRGGHKLHRLARWSGRLLSGKACVRP